ncbi:MAG: hypothetical protein ACK8QZ_01560 [Anaerolineales bacterium]
MQTILRLNTVLAALLVMVMVAGCSRNAKPSPSPSISDIVIPKPSVSSTLAIGDGGLLSGEPCSPPCFLGIEPGKTAETEVPMLLTQAGLSDACEYRHYFDKITDNWIHGWYCQQIIDIEISQDGIVNSIRFELPSPVPLQSIIARYGQPDAIMVLNSGLPDYPALQADIWYERLRMLLFPKGEQRSFTYSIQPTTLIHIIRYESPDSLQDYLAYFADKSQPWRGYGAYGVPMP